MPAATKPKPKAAAKKTFSAEDVDRLVSCALAKRAEQERAEGAKPVAEEEEEPSLGLSARTSLSRVSSVPEMAVVPVPPLPEAPKRKRSTATKRAGAAKWRSDPDGAADITMANAVARATRRAPTREGDADLRGSRAVGDAVRATRGKREAERFRKAQEAWSHMDDDARAEIMADWEGFREHVERDLPRRLVEDGAFHDDETFRHWKATLKKEQALCRGEFKPTGASKTYSPEVQKFAAYSASEAKQLRQRRFDEDRGIVRPDAHYERPRFERPVAPLEAGKRTRMTLPAGVDIEQWRQPLVVNPGPAPAVLESQDSWADFDLMD